MKRYKPPFEFETINAEGQIITINCHQVLRSIPDRRIACLGRYQGQPAFIKIFFHKNRAQQHWERECRGIQLLLENSIPVPDLLFAGKETGGTDQVLVQDLENNPVNFTDVWNEDHSSAFAHIENIISLIVKMHLAGICQLDLHPDNFLLTEDGPYCIDMAMLTANDKPLSATSSYRNIALLAAQFSPIGEETEKEFWRRYCQQRDKSWYEKYLSDYENEIIVCKSARADKLLKKLYRSSSSYIYHKDFRKRFCIKRSWKVIDSDNCLQKPEIFFSNSNIHFLKQGGSSTVIKTEMNGKELVIKRYNIKSIFHGLKRAFRRTRASRSWVMSYLLQMYDIHTPAPVAFFENRFGPIRRVSYFICEYLPGPSLLDYFPDDKPLTDEQKTIADKVVLMLQNIRKAGIYHGDMKATNLIINNGKVWLFDLDGMRWYQDGNKSGSHYKKDLKRFLRNWKQDSTIYKYFTSKLNVE